MEDISTLIARLWKRIVTTGAVLWGDFTLASGAKSRYYFDGKRVTADPEGVYLVAQLIGELLRDSGVEAIGGLEVGAVPIATNIAHLSYIRQEPIPAFWVRKERRSHGTMQRIEGLLPSRGGTVAIVDDVITTGDSVFDAIKVVEAEGCRVGKVVVIVDRHQDGSEKLRASGYDFAAIFGAQSDGQFFVEYPGQPRVACKGSLVEAA